MTGHHEHHKAADSTVDEKIETNGTTATIPQNVKIPSIWIARGFYTVIILFLGYLSHMATRLETGLTNNQSEITKLTLIVHDLPSQDYVSKITDSLNARLQVLELWQSKTQADRFTASDGYNLSKEIAQLRLDFTETTQKGKEDCKAAIEAKAKELQREFELYHSAHQSQSIAK